MFFWNCVCVCDSALTAFSPLDVLVSDMDWHETFYLEASEGQKDQAGQVR
jgi:hypothetical protein